MSDAQIAPIYRADYSKSEIDALKADCEQTMRNEIAASDSFEFDARDLDAWTEYSVFLYGRELASIGRKLGLRV